MRSQTSSPWLAFFAPLGQRETRWTLGVIAIALGVAIPVLVVFSSLLHLFHGGGAIWVHLWQTVLPRYLLNSVALFLAVGMGVTLVGVSTAWLVTLCRFPGVRFWEWALLLPLAAPAYILAYVYTGWLDYYGPVQTALRRWFHWESMNDYWFPPVRSLPGAAMMLILVLYPYVYLLARIAFLEQSTVTLEASRILGCGPWGSFWRVALPLARPAIAAGTALALMETLSDFGTVQYFGVDTFTTGIYRTWFGMGDRLGASQLAALLLIFVVLLIAAEQKFRHQARYYQSGQQRSPAAYALRGWSQLAAQVTCGIPVMLGFLLPAGILLTMVKDDLPAFREKRFWDFANHSLVLSAITAIVALLLAVVLAYGLRLYPNVLSTLAIRLASLGYAVPGSVIAVGVLIPLGRWDNGWGDRLGWILSGSLVALIFAYLVRLLAVAYGAVQTSLLRIQPHLDEAAASLGANPLSTLGQIHFPLMRGGLITALILVFVDVMKELPATLIIRPFNFDTLAVRVYQLAADERLAEAAAPALAIVVVGLLPVILLSAQLRRS